MNRDLPPCDAILALALTIDGKQRHMQLVRVDTHNGATRPEVVAVEPFERETPSTIVARHLTIENNIITDLS